MDDSVFRVVHVGDLHFWSLRLGPMDLMGKRLLGWGNLVFGGRKDKFRMEGAERLADRLREAGPDWLLFSGDFSSTSRREEFHRARMRMLPAAREASLTLFVPGNHDVYTRRELRRRSYADALGEEFRPVLDATGHRSGSGIAVLALNATTSNGIGSHGKLTMRHLEAAEELWKSWREENIRQLLILCHFPPEEPPGVLPHDRGLQLREAQPFLAWLTDSVPVPKLWLHGHHHYRWLYGSPTVPGLTYLNAGAPLLARKGAPPDLGFHEVGFAGRGVPPVVRTHFRNAAGEWSWRDSQLPDAGKYINLEQQAEQKKTGPG